MAGKHVNGRRSGASARGVAALLLAVLITGAAVSTGASADAAFRAWIDALWPEAKALGVTRATFDAAFRGVTPDLALPDLELPGQPEKGQAEFTRPPQDYLNRAYLQKLGEQGKVLRTQHAATLARIEREIGVEGSIILAIWGRETAYGAHKPTHYAIRVLATQAYVGKRKELFRKELLYGLKMLEDRIVTVETMRSSWAGAMGLTQFMPTEFYEHTHDLDGDGRADLFGSVPDALASAARQLKGKGWVTGLPWGFEVRLSPAIDCSSEGPMNERPIAEWVKLGLSRVDGRPFPAVTLKHPAYLMSPGGAFGPSFLVTENYKVVRRYNMSDLYATFVGNLADRIAGGGDFATPWRNVAQLSAKSVEEIQGRMQALGYGVDKIDGKVGSNTRFNIGRYQRDNRIAVDCWPSEATLRHMRSLAHR
jgi:lytic murein transglycosylase